MGDTCLVDGAKIKKGQKPVLSRNVTVFLKKQGLFPPPASKCPPPAKKVGAFADDEVERKAVKP